MATKNSHIRFLTAIFCFSVLAKFIFFMFFLKNNPCQLEFDSSHYHNIALQILKTGTISDQHGNPQFYRVPAYPIFLAACYKIFGQNPIFVIFLQILLGALISILIYFLALTLFPGQFEVAKLASLISCFNVGYLIFPGLILTETLFLLFFILFLILFLRNLNLFFEKRRPPPLNFFEVFLAGIFLGLACLTRQIAPATLATLFFIILFSRQRLKSGGSIVIGFFATTFWWLARNYVLTGYIFFGTLSGAHFLTHVVARLEMMIQNISYDQAKINIKQTFDKLVEQKQIELKRPLHEIERCQIAEQLTIKYSTLKPLITLKLFLTNILKTMFGLYSSELLFIDSGGKLPEYSNDRGLSTMLKRFLLPTVSNKLIIAVIYFEILLFLIILFGFALFCLAALINFDNFCVLFKILPFIGSMLFITLACGYARLRLPIEAFLIILASKTWFDIFKGK